MDTKSILNARKKLNELASQHNKLTTLVACLLNEINSVKKELNEMKNGEIQNNGSQMSNQYQQPQQMSNMQSNNQMQNMQSNQQRVSSSQMQSKPSNKFTNFSDLRAEEILQQLSINNTGGSTSIDN
jgi:ABC-type sulfate/molybdate transport systems ATPase subunit